MRAALARRARRHAWLSLLGWISMPSAAITPPPPAYQLAAHDAGVPSVVLFAVALQESGTHLQGRVIPWPWTLNVAGTAYRYRTRAAACRALHVALPIVGATHVDVGLTQINLGYHRERFADPCDALDPYRNLDAAASILREQHVAGEDWLAAVGRYHRPAGGAIAARYRQQVAVRLARVLDTTYP
ncbi:transglycosylase SLT domain-containing protein [Burkholderia pseudomallei]|uniref:transglycosylase SLT domain-containing protein n=1 Tax=Burkholderia pseudomallei TaxID=28450 RepID=UPI000F055D4F|nr:transglycosylase SLT domain protein [Burkholderia pseudomallei]VBT19783.1 lytic transglycosylase catalytic [Burkholderia pseudomallei]